VLKHGGLIGESKWDFLKHLEGTARTTLPSCMISNQLMPSEILERIGRTGLKFPFVVKPDVGQRGFGVRIVHNEDDLFEYLTLSEGDVIAQQKSQYLKEAGVFYIRQPASKEGFLFSLTVKQFPFVVGDGVARLGDLILNDHRARIIANTYFQRHLESLDKTLARGEMFVLTECGNHCQGAVFVNGRSLMSDQLLKAVEHATSRIPDFYFGRIDVRYSSDELLHQGLDFEIIEVNGAGAEATHIWDTRTTLVEAYKVLFQQWRYLFSIGAVLRARGQFKQANSLDFLQDCYRVYFRKGPLTVSS